MHKKIPSIFTFISDFKKEEILKVAKNVGIIFRNYKENHNKDKIIQLRQFCKSNNKKIYLANNFKLAIKLNLDGVYIPSFNKSLMFKNLNLKKNFIILGSAHNIREIKIKEKQWVDVIFLSPLFKTKKYKKCLEIIKFSIISNISKKKIIALGGINKNNINRLKITNAYGFSGISYFFK